MDRLRALAILRRGRSKGNPNLECSDFLTSTREVTGRFRFQLCDEAKEYQNTDCLAHFLSSKQSLFSLKKHWELEDIVRGEGTSFTPGT